MQGQYGGEGSNKRDPWWCEVEKSLVSTFWMPMLGCRFKAYSHRILDYWHLTSLMWFLLEKQMGCLPRFLKCYTLTGLQSTVYGWTGFFLGGVVMVYCVFVLAVKEYFRGSIGVLEIYKSMLLITQTAKTCCVHLPPLHQQPSSSASENAHSMSTLETG